MASKQIFQLTSQPSPATSYVVPAQDAAGGAEAVKVSLAQIKAALALNLVDNVADLNKPISTAAQTALNLKAPLASPTLTGTPTAPTAAPGTNTNQIATTAFVTAAVDAAQTFIDGAFFSGGDSLINPLRPLDGGITFAKFQTINSQRLLGRFAGTNGVMQQISIGSGLTLDSTTGVLTSSGGGGGSSDKVLLASGNWTAQNAQDLALTDQVTYTFYEIELYDLVFQNDGSSIFIRTSNDGSTFAAASGDYQWRYDEGAVTQDDGNSGSGANTQQIQVATGVKSPNTITGHIYLKIVGAVNSGTSTTINYESHLQGGFGFKIHTDGFGARVSNQVVVTARVYLNGTNTFTGKYKIYGLK